MSGYLHFACTFLHLKNKQQLAFKWFLFSGEAIDDVVLQAFSNLFRPHLSTPSTHGKIKRYIPVSTIKCWPFLLLFHTHTVKARRWCRILHFILWIHGLFLSIMWFSNGTSGHFQPVFVTNSANIVLEILKVFPAFHSDKYFKENTVFSFTIKSFFFVPEPRLCLDGLFF